MSLMKPASEKQAKAPRAKSLPRGNKTPVVEKDFPAHAYYRGTSPFLIRVWQVVLLILAISFQVSAIPSIDAS